MARFKVGQRVRVVESEFRDVLGAICTITGLPCPRRVDNSSEEESGYLVDLGPTADVLAMYPGVTWMCFAEHTLAPVDDGWERLAGGWAECVWKPKQRETV